MESKPRLLERAYQLAREGRPLSEIRKTLDQEGYDQRSLLRGKTLIADLKRAAKAGTKSEVG